MAHLARTTSAVLTGVLTALALLLGSLALAPAAHAEDGFKYWGYYQFDGGTWTAAQKGADAITPRDGSIEGWHFAVTTTQPNRPPRIDATFQDICAGSTAEQGEKRVAVAIDYGTDAEAPQGDQPPRPVAHCAIVPRDANGLQVLQSAAQVRVENGLACGIDGYPSSGCGTPVSDIEVPSNEEPVEFAMPDSAAGQDGGSAEGDQQAASSTSENDGSPWPLVGVGAVVLVLAGGAVLLARRRA